MPGGPGVEVRSTASRRTRCISISSHETRPHGRCRLFAAAGALAQTRRPITAQDLWAFQRVGAPVPAPDGRTAVFAVTEWSIPKSKSTSSLWLVDVASGETRRLTQGGTDGAPAWSPDGSRVAFVSKRGDDDAAALYAIRIGGGEAQRVASAPYGFRAPKWLSNSRIAALTQVLPDLSGKLEKSDLEAMRKEMKRRKDSLMTGRATEDRQYRFWDRTLAEGVADKLVAVDAESGALTDLTPGWNRLFSTVMEPGFDVSPDGKVIAMAVNATPPPYRERTNLDVYVIPTDGSGAMRDLTASNPFADDTPRFSPDGRSVFYLREAKANAGNRRIARVDLATGSSATLTNAYDRSFDAVSFSGDGKTFFATSEDRGIVGIFRLAADGSGLSRVYADGTSTGSSARGGSILFLNDASNRASEVHALDAARGTARRLTHLNDALLATLDLGRTEAREFRGAGGDLVQMFVTYPAGFDPARKYPLVQVLHGGPHTMFRDDFGYRWNQHIFASPGYVVARVNRHGSTGFGEAFPSSIDAAWGDKPTADILAATDVLVKDIPAIDGTRGGGRRRQLRRIPRGVAARPHRPVPLSRQPRRRERLHHRVRQRLDQLRVRLHRLGRHAVEGHRGDAAQQPDDVREGLQDADAPHRGRARLPRPLRQQPVALRRAAGDGRARRVCSSIRTRTTGSCRRRTRSTGTTRSSSGWPATSAARPWRSRFSRAARRSRAHEHRASRARKTSSSSPAATRGSRRTSAAGRRSRRSSGRSRRRSASSARRSCAATRTTPRRSTASSTGRPAGSRSSARSTPRRRSSWPRRSGSTPATSSPG